MLAILAIFVAQLLSPVRIIVGAALGASLHLTKQMRGPMDIAAILITSGISEMILQAQQYARQFDFLIFGIGLIASAAWVFIGRWGASFRSRKSDEDEPPRWP